MVNENCPRSLLGLKCKPNCVCTRTIMRGAKRVNDTTIVIVHSEPFRTTSLNPRSQLCWNLDLEAKIGEVNGNVCIIVTKEPDEEPETSNMEMAI